MFRKAIPQIKFNQKVENFVSSIFTHSSTSGFKNIQTSKWNTSKLRANTTNVFVSIRNVLWTLSDTFLCFVRSAIHSTIFFFFGNPYTFNSFYLESQIFYKNSNISRVGWNKEKTTLNINLNSIGYTDKVSTWMFFVLRFWNVDMIFFTYKTRNHLDTDYLWNSLQHFVEFSWWCWCDCKHNWSWVFIGGKSERNFQYILVVLENTS